MSKLDDEKLAELQVIKLVDEMNRITKGYPIKIVGCVLVTMLKQVHDANPNVFHYYMSLADEKGWFGAGLPEKCNVDDCENPVEANGLCKEHLADKVKRPKLFLT